MAASFVESPFVTFVMVRVEVVDAPTETELASPATEPAPIATEEAPVTRVSAPKETP